MNIAFVLFCKRYKFGICLPLLLGLAYGIELASWMMLSFILMYVFTSKSIIKSNLLFYSITNFGCWLLWYPQTYIGFLQCYVLALPFLARAILLTYIWVYLLEIVYEKILYPNGITATYPNELFFAGRRN